MDGDRRKGIHVHPYSPRQEAREGGMDGDQRKGERGGVFTIKGESAIVMVHSYVVVRTPIPPLEFSSFVHLP
jgi:hypothetical protein